MPSSLKITYVWTGLITVYVLLLMSVKQAEYVLAPGESASLWAIAIACGVASMAMAISLVVLKGESRPRAKWAVLWCALFVGFSAVHHVRLAEYVNSLKFERSRVALTYVEEIVEKRGGRGRPDYTLMRLATYQEAQRAGGDGAAVRMDWRQAKTWKPFTHRCTYITLSTGQLGLDLITKVEPLSESEIDSASLAVQAHCGAKPPALLQANSQNK